MNFADRMRARRGEKLPPEPDTGSIYSELVTDAGGSVKAFGFLDQIYKVAEGIRIMDLSLPQSYYLHEGKALCMRWSKPTTPGEYVVIVMYADNIPDGWVEVQSLLMEDGKMHDYAREYDSMKDVWRDVDNRLLAFMK